MFFNEDHLRVTKVRTIDGMTPVFDEQGKPQTKIVTFPDTKEVKRLLDELNGRLPNHLKMKVEQVRGYKPGSIQSQSGPDVSALEKEIAELKAMNRQLIDSQDANKKAAKQPAKEKTEAI